MSPALSSDFLQSLDSLIPMSSDDEQGFDSKSSSTSSSFTSTGESFWCPSEMSTEGDTDVSWLVHTKEDMDSIEVLTPHRPSCSIVQDREDSDEKGAPMMRDGLVAHSRALVSSLAVQLERELLRSSIMRWKAAVVTRHMQERIAYLEYKNANFKVKESFEPRCFNRVQKCLSAPHDPCLASAELLRIAYSTLRVRQRCNMAFGIKAQVTESHSSPCQLTLLKEMLGQMRGQFCHLQAFDPRTFEHEERLAFWLNIMNAAVLSWLCLSDKPPGQPGQMLPLNSWVSFLQKSHVDVGGIELSLFEIEHLILRARSQPPMGRLAWFFVQSLQEARREKAFRCERRVGHSHSDMALESAAPEVSFGISYPIRAGCPPLRVFQPQAVQVQLLLNCAHYVCRFLKVDMSKREVCLPVLFKHYSRDFGESPAEVLEFVHTALIRVPQALEDMRQLTGQQPSPADSALEAQAKLAMEQLELIQAQGQQGVSSMAASFAGVSIQVIDFDWRFDDDSQLIVCPELLALSRVPDLSNSPSVKNCSPRSNTRKATNVDIDQPQGANKDFEGIA